MKDQDRLEHLLTLKGLNKLDASRFPKINKYAIRMNERDEVKQTKLPVNAIVKYFEAFFIGPAPYDGIDI